MHEVNHASVGRVRVSRESMHDEAILAVIISVCTHAGLQLCSPLCTSYTCVQPRILLTPVNPSQVTGSNCMDKGRAYSRRM
ncbi:hypothetical protein E2C01_001375 [Portunus trituberculatus]|uniref:Uncharacterized protein n=1 Tax=Portunus trituberculatus TaxID=210409 RepID=A0A5B7CME2_PORTR|nr:hypothetical protein [Portunus trituberculatus]